MTLTRFPPIEDSELAMRVLCDSPQRLVACPELVAQLPRPLAPAELSDVDSLDWGPPRAHVWKLEGPDGARAEVRHAPRYITDDMTALRQAALRGGGVVQLPCMVVEEDLVAGRLVDILPNWVPRSGVVHAVFPTRRGMIPGVRRLMDYLAERIQR